MTATGNPPGTVKINGYFVDRTEIQNVHWLEYLNSRRAGLDSVQLRALGPDTANFWYALPVNRYKPIVLITYEQALDYCAWRSRMVSEKSGRRVTYRLPARREWIEIAKELLDTERRNAERELREVRRSIRRYPDQYFVSDVEVPKDRVHNFFDSVSEMIMDKGTAMGANNDDLTDLDNNLKRSVKYIAPNVYLGFRCIAEVE